MGHSKQGSPSNNWWGWGGEQSETRSIPGTGWGPPTIGLTLYPTMFLPSYTTHITSLSLLRSCLLAQSEISTGYTAHPVLPNFPLSLCPTGKGPS